jgi:hypothetical protein
MFLLVIAKPKPVLTMMRLFLVFLRKTPETDAQLYIYFTRTATKCKDFLIIAHIAAIKAKNNEKSGAYGG